MEIKVENGVLRSAFRIEINEFHQKILTHANKKGLSLNRPFLLFKLIDY